MRWFGPDDPVSLTFIRQAECSEVVTALHHIPNGEIWDSDSIGCRITEVENAGLKWKVVESLPIHEDIKTQSGQFQQLIENYKASLHNLAESGIEVVAYNFMPVLDWTRTDLKYKLENGSYALRMDYLALVAFDIAILKRKNAEADYDKVIIKKALDYFSSLSTSEKHLLTENVIAGLPGSEEKYDLSVFEDRLESYRNITHHQLRSRLVDFLNEIIPVAEELNIKMAIHPDDPPYDIFGLPRIISTEQDLEYIFSQVPSTANGLCFCTGSLAVNPKNDLLSILKKYCNRIHFLHLRNIKITGYKSFYESNHLNGEVDMRKVVKLVQNLSEYHNISLPMRPDHGHYLEAEQNESANSGYSGIGRLKGLAELRGLVEGLNHS